MKMNYFECIMISKLGDKQATSCCKLPDMCSCQVLPYDFQRVWPYTIHVSSLQKIDTAFAIRVHSRPYVNITCYYV